MRTTKITIPLLCLAWLTSCQADKSKELKTKSQELEVKSVSKVYVSDNGDGTYTNPILQADYSDPDVIRVGDDFYMTASSFNSSPGLPILHSKDLVNWQIVNYALPVLPEEVYDSPQYSKGVWAPCIRYYNNEFYIFWGDPDFGIYRVKTNDPFEEWEKPVLVKAGKGMIDPSPLWDDDGNAYLVTAWAGSRAGVNSILTVWRMSPDATELLDNGRNIYSGHDYNHTIEGPKIYKKDACYYIMAPAGGVENGWQLALRSQSIYGPYEEKIVMAQGSTDINGPHQGAYIETQSGEPWFVHFQDRGVYGRILHLNPVNWFDGWPVMGEDQDRDGCGDPVRTHQKPDVGREWPIASPAESDEFDGEKPGLQWSWNANEKVNWSVSMPQKGFLRLLAVPKPTGEASLWNVPNILTQHLPAENFTATTKVSLNIEWDIWQSKQAGLMMLGNNYSYLAIRKDADSFYVEQIQNEGANLGGFEKSIAKRRIGSNTVFLRVKVEGPDGLCHFSFSEDGENFRPIGEDFYATRVLWSSAKLGIFSTSEPGFRIGGCADFDWFRITK
ncbi:glycoside hydrolase family 43 protein [Gaoshiqia sediminis]|uniref:Glycoside hydrolase 43 family protein n=1 Tax=Gaoshiqia sediminis TaxID=2986998 RepID=A0AA42C9N8_9BACT|nr:glycoside hydrolase 43 family protein [Gaoshiqia sediminis]MCW0482390.1 glycoside hydrolase 43 family protein [Gaoshiqia sediminis]